jgi:hypothetical protein
MLGNLIMPRTEGDSIVEETDFNKLNQHQGNVLITNFINRITKKLERLELADRNGNNSIKLEYSNFQPLGDKSFPYTGTVNVLYKTSTGSIINNSISFEYNKAEIGDKELKFPFNIPKRYERR